MGLTIINNFIMVRLVFLCLINFSIREYYKYIGKKGIIMSRVLLSGDNQITGNSQKIWNALQSAGRRIHHPY